MLSNVKIDTKSDSRAQAYEHNSYLLIYTIADLKNYPDMALPPIATATLQAALVNAGSNVLAQGIKAWRDQTPFVLDLQALFQFTTCAFILSPLTFVWLENLEARLPGFTEDKDVSKTEAKNGPKKQKLNVKNTVAKVIIDQTIGATINTAAFIMTMGLLRGQDFEVIKGQLRDDFVPIMLAGLKLWPFVSVLNFTVVPADKRLLVGSLFGVIWAVYLSLMSG
ncbi:Mpv17/PMP22 family protein [Aspergillus clavatus NRRL 1]|uniref:Integral membrane protein, Mpv17/PMP22 family, putative n=1 Tax=Aspergillus clavatus (strain ATCC 1007 / CBS 513.65 / DSM 816 / NCTC 3887 / NRRL 1 / QM 1276 / 107) TaxID=344612 RepID=A1CME9_ASPCL|nr:integral membrane protein, Mpv17/PMP22 family, putative [Aspergillus clavatus NRRL 1]EAW08736.1 integral membrane protein, Mpv17/PMP22 family, putative [Aspergillus clavatus NRRL 1]